MNFPSHCPAVWTVATAILAGAAFAFPPAPHHVVHGLVRDERGNLMSLPNSMVVLESGGAPVGTASIRNFSTVEGNYRMVIPLDSGGGEAYAPKAMAPAVPFRLKVKVGTQTYLPIEMSGASTLLTRPAGKARVDLTLGVDSDGDGLPDAWERMLLAALRKQGTLADIQPEADDDRDGISNLNEYLAGTYAFDPQDGFRVELRGRENGLPLLEFLGIQGRTYTVEGSDDLRTWSRMRFAMSGEKAGAEVRESYSATGVSATRVRVGTAGGEESRFYRVMVH